MDIPEEFSGWQVIDSTPQETSDGNYRCGSASVKAIKIGKVCFPFDGRFIFAEVNSDVLYHTRDRYGKLSLQKVDKKLIGQKLVTKSPHGNYQLDITLEYKYNEDSVEGQRGNEEALATAESFGCSRENRQVLPASVSVIINAKKGYVGRPLEAQLDIVNPSGSLLQTQVLVFVETTYYTGVRSHEVHKENYNLDLPANSTQKMTLSVPPEEYMPFLGSQPNLKITVSVKLPQNEMVTESAVVSLEVLWLNIQASSPVYMGQKGTISVSFNNQLDVPLIRPTLVLEGPGLLPLKTKDFETVEPRGLLKWEVEFYPYSLGPKTLSAVLLSNNSAMAWGFVDVQVLSSSNWLPPTFGVSSFRRSGRSEDGA
ncbi:hypothetical protein NQD34_014740 [Periophthalmus magnuspinnatus]|nr:hypothetical protein NQD34_014740 [Periophthalmus magnuspinnatus]